MRSIGCSSLLVVALLVPGAAHAYEPRRHVTLTELGVALYERCAADLGVPAIDAALLARVAVATEWEDAFSAQRVANWHFYDRLDRTGRRLGRWLFAKRHMHDRLDRLVASLSGTVELEQATRLGRVIHHLQDVTVPAHVVPIYHGPFRPDELDSFDIERDRVAADLSCDDVLRVWQGTHWDTLEQAARATYERLDEAVAGTELTWRDYWLSPRSGAWGRYSEAARFGEELPLGCSAKCRLGKHDPVYREFAVRQHREAVALAAAGIVSWAVQSR